MAPRSSLLQIACDTHQCGLVAKPSDDLNPDRQAAGVLRQRQGHSRLSGDIEYASVLVKRGIRFHPFLYRQRRVGRTVDTPVR